MVARQVAVAELKAKRSDLYRPAVAREEMTRQEVRSVFDRVLGAAVSPVLAHFLDEAELTDEDIRKLQKLLDEKRRKRPGGGSGGRGRRGRSS